MQSVKEGRTRFVSLFLVILVAAAIYLPTIISPPSLMDDSDAVEAQRTELQAKLVQAQAALQERIHLHFL